ncbi:hypothetical protein PVAP13_6KG237300 [Panicum virgatum]|nr:hypothetical protein PVAP13_6KG237300 [Panicum virgatum]
MSPGAALFLFCNVLVGAIVVTSRGGQGASTTRRLCRSASSMVLGRLRSFTMFSVLFEEGYHPSLELEAEEEQHQPAVAEPASAAAATASTTSESAAAEEVAGGNGKDNMPVCSEEAHGPARLSSPPSVAVSAAAAEATAAAERPAATVAESIMQRARACRREVVEEALEGKAALNARAELFIRQFREDLKLQRLNSIVNYTRALRRGAGAGPATAAGQ